MKERRKKTVEAKLAYRISDRIRKNLRSNKFKKCRGTKDILGCTVQELKVYLEKQFTPQMNWGNHGTKGWHIDHIKPLSLAKTEEEIYKLWHYTNLQPLWWIDNIKKGNKYEEK